MAVTLVKTKEFLTYRDFLAELERLQELAPLRVFCEIGRFFDVSSLSQQAKHTDQKELAIQIQSLCRTYRDRNQLNYIQSLNA